MYASFGKLIHTKILATLGPASDNADMLQRLIEAGADAFRLNFSHGSLDEHGQTLQRIRDCAKQVGANVAIVGDLCGPKIRVDPLANKSIEIQTGDELIITRATSDGTNNRISCSYDRLIDEIEVGHRVLIDDGAVRLIALEKSRNEISCQCTTGGLISTRKGLNLPDSALSVPAVTDYDWQCVDWAIGKKLDYLALSFVRRAHELHQLRDRLLAGGSDIHLIAKIEKPEAVRNIGEILEATDAIMVARGDLGVEMDVARVPIIQKDLIRRCAVANKPVIVATQMLQSMIESATPTRAEVSDVANAIYDGTDAVMLSGETAVGRNPAVAVDMMNHVAEVTEDYLFELPPLPLGDQQCEIAAAEESALARGAAQMARTLHVKLIVVWSQSGVMARFFSKLRPSVPVVALSADTAALRRMSLYFGILPVHMDVPDSLEDLVPRIDQMLQDRRLAHTGESILIVGGTALGKPGRANAVMMHKIGQQY